MSAANRNRGARAEVAVVNYLRSQGTPCAGRMGDRKDSGPGAVGAAPDRGQHLVGGAVVAHRTPLQRFWARVDREGPGGCWLWPTVDRQTGYGRISVGGSAQSTHRFAYQTFVGPIPEGYVVDHLCRVRACCNPAHLEPVTNRENTIRGLAPLLARTRHAATTCCPSGHPYDEANTYYNRNGQRSCRACARRRGNGLTSVPMCRSCGKRHAGNRYPVGDALSVESGRAHRTYEGVRLCDLPLTREVWVG